MAATSTNKQPLLVDRVLHYVVNLDTAAVAAIDVAGTNTALLIVDGTTQDGAIIEDIYSIARGTEASTINLYLSGSSDYLRPTEGVLIGQFKSGITVGAVTSWTTMPKVLAPMPHTPNSSTVTTIVTPDGESPETVTTTTATATDNQFRALYIPKGKALWAARQSNTISTDGPLLGCQGGWY
jgi:hypothetical protein